MIDPTNTNAGGLVAFGLFLRRWTVQDCKRVFKTLAQKFFGKQQAAARGFLIPHRLVALFRSWLRDGVYDAKDFEIALEQEFGQRRVFDSSYTSHYKTKVAVTATTISDAQPVVISNYNGTERAKDSGKKRLTSISFIMLIDTRIQTFTTRGYSRRTLHLASRSRYICCTSVRPTTSTSILKTLTQFRFFKTASFSFGTFQDGGLKHNNPVNIALWECQHIWPAVKSPDVVVSLGTGTEKQAQNSSPQRDTFRHIWRDGFIPRLFRSFMSSIDGENAWRDLWNRLDTHSRKQYFRLNVIFPTSMPEPGIDDLGSLEELPLLVRTQAKGTPARQEVVSALLISNFFYELESLPVFKSGKFECKGAIHCRIEPIAVFRSLTRVGLSDLELFNGKEGLGVYLSEDGICDGCHRYNRRFMIRLRHLEDSVNLSVKIGQDQRSISGCPRSMQWFIEQQGLADPFGSFAQVPRSKTHSSCERRKRARPPSSPTIVTKRPRYF